MNTSTEINTLTLTKEQIDSLQALLSQASKVESIPKTIKSSKNQEEPKRKGCIEVLKSGNYRFKYKFEGTLYRETFGGIKDICEAEKELDLWINSIENGAYKKKNLLVSDWCQEWLDNKIRPNCSGTRTPDKYKNFINNRFLPIFRKKIFKFYYKGRHGKILQSVKVRKNYV